ncbi:MAG: glycosyltransferase [Bacteroidetes bacterium]|nr:glycosyltransferase [Bacteroidota bacterium]
MKILFLTYDGLSDPLGQSQILPYFLGLARYGHEITIVSSEKKQNEMLIESIREELNRNQIRWINIMYTKSPPILSSIYDILKMKRICDRLCRSIPFDLVHCRSSITSLIGLHLKKKWGLRFIFDMRGFYADERIDGGMWNQENIIYKIIYRYFKKKETAFLSKADYTICLTENAKQEIHSWKSIPNQPIPIKVIPCCADSDLFNAKNIPDETRERFRMELHLDKDDFVLSYIGALGTWYMPDEMLDFFKRLLIRKPGAKFLFITHEDPKLILGKAGAKHIPPEKIIIYKAKHNDVPALLSLSQVSIFFIKPLYSKKASSPVKQGEIMSMGIPIICNSNVGDTDKIIRTSESGSIVRNFANDDYDFVVEELPRLLALPKDKIRNSAIAYFSLQRGIEKYNDAYNSLHPVMHDGTIHSG